MYELKYVWTAGHPVVFIQFESCVEHLVTDHFIRWRFLWIPATCLFSLSLGVIGLPKIDIFVVCAIRFCLCNYLVLGLSMRYIDTS